MSTYNKEEALQQEIRELLKEQEGSSTPVPEQETPKEVVKETPQETGTITEPVQEQEESDIVKQARALGWKPKGDYAGEHYVEPEEYVRRQPLFERIEKQSKELRDLKEAQRQNANHLAQVRREAYEQAIRDLESRRETAVQEANIDEYRRLDAQTKNLNQRMQQDPIVNHVQDVPQIDPELVAFNNKHGHWYNENTAENAKMKALAVTVDNYLAKQAQIDNKKINVKEHLATVEAEVRRLFPHRFEQTKTSSQNTAPSVGKSTASSTTGKSSSNLVSRLTPQQRELGEKFNKSNKDFTLEEYAKQLDSMGRLGK